MYIHVPKLIDQYMYHSEEDLLRYGHYCMTQIS